MSRLPHSPPPSAPSAPPPSSLSMSRPLLLRRPANLQFAICNFQSRLLLAAEPDRTSGPVVSAKGRHSPERFPAALCRDAATPGFMAQCIRQSEWRLSFEPQPAICPAFLPHIRPSPFALRASTFSLQPSAFSLNSRLPANRLGAIMARDGFGVFELIGRMTQWTRFLLR